MIYLTLDQVIKNHDLLIEKYGGSEGIRDITLLISAISMPRATMFGNDLHPKIHDKAAAYLFHIVKNHPFVDGNKRSGAHSALTFLELNGVTIDFNEAQWSELEELIVSIAQGAKSKKEVTVFLKSATKKKKRIAK